MSNLVPLRVVTTCNASDTEILANLRASRERAAPMLQLATRLAEKPLLIVGSGPSAREALKDFDLSKVDIMALNGAYRYLIECGWVADYYAQIDARAVNVNFVEKVDDHTQFLLAAQVHPDVFDKLKDRKVTMFHLATQTTQTIFPEAEGMFVGGITTIGPTAITLGGLLGYRDIWLLGFDSSFSTAKEAWHLMHQPQNDDQKTLDVEFDGKFYRTTHALAQQVTDFLNWSNMLHKTFDGLSLSAHGDGLFYDYLKCAGEKRPEITTVGEAEKYGDMYRMESYKMPAHRRQAVQDIIASAKAYSLLDVGTGRGETLQVARALGYAVKGTETVDALLGPDVVKAYLPNLPFKDGEFDVVTCFEVLEHLLPKDVEAAIAELLRVAKRQVFVSVCTAEDWVGGVNLHPSATTEVFWRIRFMMAGAKEMENIGNFSTRGVSPVYRLVGAAAAAKQVA